MSLISSAVEVNDIFEELLDENKRLLKELVFANKCLNVLNKFKTFVDLVFNNYKIDFNSNDSQSYQTLKAEVEEVLNESQKSNEHLIEDPEEEGVVDSEEPSTQCLKQTTNKVIELFECKVNGCQYKTTVSEGFEQHLNENHKNLSKKFKCLFCCQSFLSELSVKSHMRRDHSKQQMECLKPKPNKSIELKSKCDINGSNFKKQFKSRHKGIQMFACGYKHCDKSFYSEDLLKSHLKLQHQKGLKVCEFDGCDFKTNKLIYLVNHENTVHKGIRPFKCPQCESAFGAYENLMNHIRTCHRNAIQCEYSGCEKWLKSRYILKQHIDRMHLNIRPEIEYICDVCEPICEPSCQYKSPFPFMVKSHKKTVHTNERPFSCNYDGCEKKYKTKDVLKVHKRTHEKRCPAFKCCECDKSFNTNRTLKLHTICKHSDAAHHCDWPGCDYVAKLETALKKHKLVHKTERNFPCDWPECHKRFKTRYYLDQHIRVHTNDKKYVCKWPGCQYRTAFSQNLSKHKKKHEN